jgi:hypothetical protein
MLRAPFAAQNTLDVTLYAVIFARDRSEQCGQMNIVSDCSATQQNLRASEGSAS